MKILPYFSVLISFVLLTGCQNGDTTSAELELVDEDVFIMDSSAHSLQRGNINMIKPKVEDEGFVIARGQKPYLLSAFAMDSTISLDRDTLAMSIISSPDILSGLDMNLNWTNAILDSMKAGFLFDTFPETIGLINLENLNTNGKVNTDNIIKQLDKFLIDLDYHDGVDSLNKIVVLLFDDSEFFNTANAIAINHGGKHYIFGDAKLLISPMIFLHELGHSFNLTHANDNIQACPTLYNIMHESNIGCTAGFNARQLALMSINKYIDKTEEVFYPSIHNCFCTNMDRFKGEVEQYLNSIDRNIDDTPLVGDHGNIDVVLGNVIGKDSTTFKLNYKEEYKRFINDGQLDSYVSNRLKSHLKLRNNNLSRWLNHNRESVGLPMLPITEVRNTDNLNTYNNRRDSITMYACEGNMHSCAAKLECLKSRMKESNTFSLEQLGMMKDLETRNTNNNTVIDSLNIKIRRLLTSMEKAVAKNPQNEDIKELEKMTKEIIYEKPRLIENFKKNYK